MGQRGLIKETGIREMFSLIPDKKILRFNVNIKEKKIKGVKLC